MTFKRICTAAAAAVISIAALCTVSFAADLDPIAQQLSTIGVFRGSDVGFELSRVPTRGEAAAMLVRLYGAEEALEEKEPPQDEQEEQAEETAQEAVSLPFTDVTGWQKPYVAWLYENGLTKGMSDTQFSTNYACRARDYAVFLLRALGYADNADFTYLTALEKAQELGIYDEALLGGSFTRGDLALMTWLALGTDKKDENVTLLSALSKSGAIDKSAASGLEKAMRSGVTAELTEDGLLISASAWREAKKDFSIEINFTGAGISGVQTITGEMLDELMESAGSGRLKLDTQALRAQMEQWEALYCADNAPMRFDSYIKGACELESVRCNYRLDSQALLKAVLQKLLTLTPGTIEAPIACYTMQGVRFDLQSTYVEVDIDNQQLTFIKNGALFLTTPITTGKLDGHQTPTGLYYSHNKQTNCTLVGSDFRVFVKYWISIVGDVIGFHDASWRSYFGGEDYVDNGSHGCINTPEAAMTRLFYNLDDGTPVLIHGRNVHYVVGSEDSPVTKEPVHTVRNSF